MSDNALKKELKELIFIESRDEQRTPEDGLKIGLLDNQGIYDNIVSLINYYKDVSTDN